MRDASEVRMRAQRRGRSRIVVIVVSSRPLVRCITRRSA